MAQKPRTKAQAGFGSTFGIKAIGASDYTKVAEVTAITPPGQTRDTIDATHLESPDGVKEFIGGLIEGGEASITINFEAEQAIALQTRFATDGGAADYRITFPKGTHALDFAGVATEFTLGEIVGDDKMSATFNIKASGLPAIDLV